MKETTNIYILIDPRTGHVRYVGKANDIKQRYKAHLNKSRKHQLHKKNWINLLKRHNLKPEIVIIDVVSISEWQFWESYWISQFKAWGFNLINYTLGGDGTSFGNDTSFKRGSKAWNSDTIKKRICKYCGLEFKPISNYSKQKYCSVSCSSKNIQTKSQFKKGRIPWNKNKSGYGLKPKPVLQIDKDTDQVINKYLSCQDAGIAMGCSAENIRNVCRGRSKTAKGFKWKYHLEFNHS